LLAPGSAQRRADLAASEQQALSQISRLIHTTAARMECG
jgi:hypothetical protein